MNPAPESTCRCFVGLRWHNADAFSPLHAALAGSDSAGLRLMPADNLHVTLKFLGGVTEALLAEVLSLLDHTLPRFPSIRLQARGLARFPRYLVAPITADPNLTAIAKTLDTRLALLGVAAESRQFRPHVTLARWGKQETAPLFTPELESRVWGEELAREVHLYRSDTLPEGARYTIIRSWPLA